MLKINARTGLPFVDSRKFGLDWKRIHWVVADLDAFPLPSARFEAVFDILYLNRGLVQAIEESLVPGGLLFFVARLDPEGRGFRVRPGETRTLFPKLEILDFEEGTTASNGESRLLARRIV
jgi:SAM-dependent methyltransferase